MAVLDILERAVSQGVQLDSDGSVLYVRGHAPPSLRPLIDSHRPALIALLAEQRRVGGDSDSWGDPVNYSKETQNGRQAR
jgi:hypothetical protein